MSMTVYPHMYHPTVPERKFLLSIMKSLGFFFGSHTQLWTYVPTWKPLQWMRRRVKVRALVETRIGLKIKGSAEIKCYETQFSPKSNLFLYGKTFGSMTESDWVVWMFSSVHRADSLISKESPSIVGWLSATSQEMVYQSWGLLKIQFVITIQIKICSISIGGTFFYLCILSCVLKWIMQHLADKIQKQTMYHTWILKECHIMTAQLNITTSNSLKLISQ